MLSSERRAPFIPLLCAASLVLSAACSGTGPGGQDTPSPPASSVTFYKDIAPLVNTYCLSCHTQGGVAPFALDTAQAATAWGQAMVQSVQDRTMPPYYVNNDGSCQTFTTPWMSDDEIALFTSWAAGGYAAGDATDAPDPYVPPAGLGDDTTTFTMPQRYTPVISGNPSDPKDDYRCFLMSSGLAEDRFVTAFEMLPGNNTIVHHMLAYTVDPLHEVGEDSDGNAITNADVINDLIAEDPDRGGWPCYGLTGAGTLPSGLVASWAPGTGVLQMPEGTGISLRGGDWLVAQIHYNLDYGAGTDQSAVKLELSETVNQEAYFVGPDGLLPTLYEGDPFVIAPGDASVSFEWTGRVQDLTDYIATYYGDRFETLPTEYDVYGIAPHMHELGSKFHATLKDTSAGSEACIADMPTWDFNWQHLYFYEQPIHFGPEHEAVITCTYDSRGATGPTLPGYGSSDEMCLFGIYFTAR